MERDYSHEKNWWTNFSESDEGRNYFTYMCFEDSKFDILLENQIKNSKIKKKIINILDVGCGPVTCLGYKSNQYLINLTGVDPLLDHYDMLLKRLNLKRPFQTYKAESENISKFFNKQFDVVFSRNAIDHTSNPILSISECTKVCNFSDGGFVFIKLMPNEGKHANYVGLHQWNFYLEGDEVVCESRNGDKFFLSKEFKNYNIITGKNILNQDNYEFEITIKIEG